MKPWLIHISNSPLLIHSTNSVTNSFHISNSPLLLIPPIHSAFEIDSARSESEISQIRIRSLRQLVKESVSIFQSCNGVKEEGIRGYCSSFYVRETVPVENKEQSEVGGSEAANMEEDGIADADKSYGYGNNIDANDSRMPVTIDRLTSPPAQQAIGSEPSRRRKETLMIVDYGHDEAALSPEPEKSKNIRSPLFVEAFEIEHQATDGSYVEDASRDLVVMERRRTCRAHGRINRQYFRKSY